MPSTFVYFVLPSLIALMAASLMLSGVSKSGSPAPRLITSLPAAFRSRALDETAMVGEGFTRASASDRKAIVLLQDGITAGSYASLARGARGSCAMPQGFGNFP